MTAEGVIISVRRVDDDITECRRCGSQIGRGRRVVLVSGLGNSCLSCLLGGEAAVQSGVQQGAAEEEQLNAGQDKETR